MLKSIPVETKRSVATIRGLAVDDPMFRNRKKIMNGDITLEAR